MGGGGGGGGEGREEFHPQKCNVLRVTRARSPIQHPCRLKGQLLEIQDSSKYLGVDLQSSLSWKNYIDRVIKKANSTLGFLRRNLKTASEKAKITAYLSMARTNLEYCCSVWNPHHKEQIRKLEMVQRRTARYITHRYRNTSSISSMLQYLQWKSLESRRSKIQLILFYKVVHDLVNKQVSDYLTPASGRTRSAHSKKFRQFLTSNNSFKFCLYFFFFFFSFFFFQEPFLYGIPYQLL